MARWTARCWMGSNVGYQDCEVNANTPSGANDQLKRIYGATQIVNLRQVGNGGLFSGSGSSGSSDGSGTFGALVLVGGAYLVYKFWTFFVISFWVGVGVISIWTLYKIIQYFKK